MSEVSKQQPTHPNQAKNKTKAVEKKLLKILMVGISKILHNFLQNIHTVTF
jgi:hypothetical protein